MIDQVEAGGGTRTRIVLAAMELFWEKGYQSTSVADLLQRAGVHSGSLYHYFPGKQDVLLAVLDTYRGGIDEMLLAPAWKDVRRSDRPGLRAACEVPRAHRADRLHLRLPDRQPRARTARARPAGARTARGQFHGVDRCDSRLPARCRPAPAEGCRRRRAGDVRADDDGGWRDARAHVSRRGAVRRRRRPAARPFRPPARAGGAADSRRPKAKIGRRRS